MAERTVKVRLEAATAQYQAAMAKASATSREFGRNIAGVGDTSDKSLKRVSRGALIASGALVAGLGLSAKAAIDWESAWAGVTKTVDGSAKELSTLEGGLRNMAKELPATHGEIASVAEAAGQLGVKVGDIEKFTGVMIDLGETTNLTADEAATSLARISNIMGTSARDVDRMGSTIVELGNNSATTEAEIVALATRLAAAGKIAGLSEADVFAFASTLTSVGVEAEAGGTALSKVFTKVRDSVIDGGDALDTFAEVAGVTTAEFRSAFETNAAGAIEMFIAGLGRLNESGASTTAVFEDLELTDQRLMRALLSTASAGDLLTNQLELGNRAWEENNALQTEAEKRYATTSAKMEMARNKAVDLGISAGSVLLPALNSTLDVIGTMADGLADLPGPAQTAAVALGGIAATGLGVVGVVGTLAPKVRDFKTALEGMGASAQFVGRNMGRMALGLGIAGVAIGVVSFVMGKQGQAAAEAEARTKAWAEAIRDAGDAAAGTAVFIEGLVKDNADLAAALAESGVTVSEMGAALVAGGDEWQQMAEKIAEGGKAAGLSDEAMLGVLARLKGLGQEAPKVKKRAEDMNAALGETEDTADGTEGAVGELTGALGEQEEALEDTVSAWEALSDALAAQFDPLFAAVDAEQDLAEAQRNVTETAKDSEASADDLADAQRNAVRAALKFEQSQLDLRSAVEDGTVSVNEAKNTLKRWVDQGLITRRQARLAGADFDRLGKKANALPDAVTIGVATRGASAVEHMLNTIARNRTSIVTVVGRGPSGQFSGGRTLAGGGLVEGFADGGAVLYRAHGGGSIFQPRGTDTVPAMLTPGEFVMQRSATNSIGVDALQQMNRTGSLPSGAGQPIVVSPAPVVIDAGGLDTSLLNWLRRSIRNSGGGDVQRFLGKN